MRTSKISITFASLLVSAMLISPVYAQEAIPDQTMNASSVPMMSGGVGSDEMEQLRQIQNQYNLKLLFTETNGVFLSEVPVRIEDKKGQVVLDTTTGGPVLLVTLPAGTYKVTAQQNGETKEQKVTVGKSLRSYQIRFTAQDERLDDMGDSQ